MAQRHTPISARSAGSSTTLEKSSTPPLAPKRQLGKTEPTLQVRLGWVNIGKVGKLHSIAIKGLSISTHQIQYSGNLQELGMRCTCLPTNKILQGYQGYRSAFFMGNRVGNKVGKELAFCPWLADRLIPPLLARLQPVIPFDI